MQYRVGDPVQIPFEIVLEASSGHINGQELRWKRTLCVGSASSPGTRVYACSLRWKNWNTLLVLEAMGNDGLRLSLRRQMGLTGRAIEWTSLCDLGKDHAGLTARSHDVYQPDIE